MSAASSDKPAVSSPAPAGVADHGCLPRGYRLREFVIEKVLGDGGFGVVYSALDLRLERRVAIKEYMPSSLARRDTTDYSVQMLTSKRHRDAFEVGLRSFINEARMLARFEHPALIKVHQFWQEKGTAYMVMPFYSAPTLRTWTRSHPEPVEEAWLRNFLLRAMEAVEVLHAEHCLHRDIAPDNILVLKDSMPLLLDFGAARRVIGDLRKALTVIVKPGFAPLEQYADTVKMKQGPWTDVYALGAVAHFILTGQAPAPAVSRMVADEVVPLRLRFKGRYSDALLGAIDTALTVNPERRPQSIAALRSLLTSERAGEWEPTRLIQHAQVGSDVHRSILANTAPAKVARSQPKSRDADTQPALSKAIALKSAPRTVPITAANAAAINTEATTLRRFTKRLPDLGTLTQAVRESVPASILHSRWLGAAGVTAALLACGGVLMLTSYVIDGYIDANTTSGARSQVIVQKPAAKSNGAAQVAAPPAESSAPQQVSQSAQQQPVQQQPAQVAAPLVAVAPAVQAPQPTIDAATEAKPAEFTLAPAKIDPASRVPAAQRAPAVRAAPAHAAPAAHAAAAATPTPAAKPKVAVAPAQQKVAAAPERQEFSGAPMMVAVVAPAAASITQPARPKTRGYEEIVPPLDRAAEITQSAAVLPVAASIVQPVATPPAAAAEPAPLRALEHPQPQFPGAAAKDGVRAGRVVAQLTIASDGGISHVEILESQPYNVFDREVRRALASWRYEAPGRQRQTNVEFVFKLDE